MTFKRGLFYKPSDIGENHFAVIWHEGDGRSHTAGHIYYSRSTGMTGRPPWFWSIDWFQRAGRAEPYQGHAETFEEALAAHKRCWNSADVPFRWPPSMQR